MVLRELRRLQPVQADLPVIRKIRDVLTDAREVAERYREGEFSDEGISAPWRRSRRPANRSNRDTLGTKNQQDRPLPQLYQASVTITGACLSPQVM